MKSPFYRFPKYREFQEEVIEKVLQSDRGVTFIDGPPGTGKSLIGMSIASQFDHAIYLCTTKPLQSQINSDFPEYPMLMGRANYPCNYSDASFNRFPDVTCEDCTDTKEVKNECKGRCLYEKQKRLCLASSICILNTTYFLTEANMVGGFSGKDLVIIDECDKLEDAVIRFIEFDINEQTMFNLGIDIPERKTFLGWRKWAETNKLVVAKIITGMEPFITPNSSRDEIKTLKQFKSLLRKVSALSKYLDDSWVYQEEVGKYGTIYKFKPVWVSGFTQEFLWRHSDKFVLMSGTILPERTNSLQQASLIPGDTGEIKVDMAKTLGIPDEGLDYIEVPNQFPTESRPVVYDPVANLTAKTILTEQEGLVTPVKKIIEKYPNSKGLIHSVSYRLNDFMMVRLGEPRLITHGTGVGQRENLLESFKRSDKPLIMMSPSMDRGIDLPQEQCRFIIILKVPYPSLGDKQISSRARSSQGNRWYAWATVCSIVQMSMRGMRSIDDRCDTWILDAQFGRFWNKHKNMFPKWWCDALMEVEWVM